MARKRGRVSAKRRLEEHKSGSERTAFEIPDGMELFKLQREGTKRIEVIPFEVGAGNPYADKGELHYERTFYVHRNVGPNQDIMVCPAKTTNKKCPICEHRTHISRSKDSDEELIKQLAPKERQLWLVVDHSEMDKGVQLWEVSYHLFGKQLDKEINNQDDDDGFEFFADPDDGLTLKLGVSEESLPGVKYYEVDSINFKERRKDLDNEWFDEAPCLDELLIILPYDELKKKFLQIEDDTDTSDNLPGEEPDRKRGKKRKKTRDEDEGEDEPRRGRKKTSRRDEDEGEDEPEPRRGRRRNRDEDEGEDEPEPRRGRKKSKKTSRRDEDEGEDDKPEKNKKQKKYPVGLKVKAEVDGKMYPGAITSCPPDGDSVLIKFEDGDELNVDCDDVELPKSEERGRSSKKKGSKKSGSKEDNWESDDNWDD